MLPLYDITLPLSARLAMWPGDVAYGFALTASLRQGDSVNVGAVTMSVHAGTHADAPFHYQEDGQSIDRIDLSAYLGPARVIDARGLDPIPAAVLEPFDLRQTPRVLFRTDAWRDHTVFPERFPLLAPDLPALLGSQGVLLVGLDVPSVDAFTSKDLPNHHALAAQQIRILESLFLAETPPGVYELIALPLKLLGADAAPLRAVLRPMPERIS